MALRDTNTGIALAVVAGTLALEALRRYLSKPQKDSELAHPPGPPPLPLVGNTFGISLKEPWVTYEEWSKQYGDIVYTKILGQDVVVINSLEVAKDMIDRRSNIYSDRAQYQSYSAYGLLFDTLFLPYGDEWRFHRRILHQVFRPDAIFAFEDIQKRKAMQLVQHLLSAPREFIRHLHTFSAGVVLDAVYSYDVKNLEDPFVKHIKEAGDRVTLVCSPQTSLLLGLFPFVKYIPTWLPGGSLNVKDFHKCIKRAQDAPFVNLQRKLDAGETPTCMATMPIPSTTTYGDNEKTAEIFRGVCATAFFGGTDTTAMTLTNLTLALVLNPQVQERVMRDIEAVVGSDRLPDLSDRSALPYIDAIVREVHRWRPLVPLGFPHYTSSDDVYNGYFIPKGTTILANSWAMSRNPSRYPNPSVFDPSRHLAADGSLLPDETNFLFGFGRRICPGRHFVNATLWIAVATMLAVLRFGPPCDEHGNEKPVEQGNTFGVASQAKPFECTIQLRGGVDKKVIELLRAEQNS
ncbi:cytochrome P450 [Coniophora puteana RWD-64-598 SS2]|uniref:Cytochrome P450 n=1 Tax=Coniophora puteana (strain RWD-64-598) TaxID=741705 RepID=A0A5M3MYR7_CONPW|nr:cytochrome P450 [Coniophora puteana RWD-64-598 SS2]EIW83934.1 cytochrome P450 [Coniophora puteana RWD-64-598 SS2]